MKNRIKILSFLFLGLSQFAFSQIKEEKLILDRKREPEVKKIDKKKTSVESEKNYPPKEKEQEAMQYDITNVPAVSDFKTSTIAGSDISPKFDTNYFDNYVQFGMGNYGKILGDANISTTLENKMQVGADAHFLSTNGLKKEYNWSSKQNSANIGAFLNGYLEKGKFNINVDYTLNDYNFYGIYALEPAADIDLQQKINQIKVDAYYDHFSNEILNDVRVKSSFLSDHFNSKESQGEVLLNLSKHGIGFSDKEVQLNADLGLNLETQKTEFSLLNKNTTNFFNATISPKVTFFKGKSYLMIGSDFSFLNAKYNNISLANEVQNNKTYWFPRAELQFAATDELKFYAGIDGGLKLNSYANLLQENPYLAPDQNLKPTETKYHFYVGLKGDINENLKYDVSAGYAKVNNISFSKAETIFDDAVSLNRSAYNFANVFSTSYENGNVSDIKGSVTYYPLSNLMLNAVLQFTKYDLDSGNDIYNTPLLKASLGAKYTMLDKKLLLGVQGFFRSDRTTNSFEITNALNPNFYVSTENTNDKVGGYADLNLSAEYKVHKNFSIFALGNNLINKKYETFKGYKVLGAQIVGGVKISF